MGIATGIVGASGYSGGELLRLLAGHPELTISKLFAARAAGTSTGNAHPNLLSLADLPIEALTAAEAADLDLVFLCLPAGGSKEIIDMLPAGAAVVDLSGDHRLPPDVYAAWYGRDAVGSCDGWVFGLTELFRSDIKGALRIANPGCYPTPAVLALAPLCSAGLIETHDVVVDAISGISGAGAQEGLVYSFTELVEDASPYRVGSHQHTPEIERALRLATGVGVAVTFTPHLVPMARGIVATCSAPLAGGATQAEIVDAAHDLYRGSTFVRIVDEPPHAKQVRGSNMCLLHYVAVPRTGRVVAIGAIDNMVKGAGGQAIQNANVALGLDETLGLSTDGIWL